MKRVVEMEEVCKSYGGSQVLDHCSLKLYEGEIYGLLGVNGAGKTTLMKLLLGLQQMDSGRILVLGKELDGDPGYLSEVGNMIETPVFYEHLNAEELLMIHLTYMNKQGDIPKVLRLVGLEQAGKKAVSQYSLGMRQRLGFARAMIHRPRLLILDEPLNGLDPVAVTEMRVLMQRLADEGLTILLSSHNIWEMRQLLLTTEADVLRTSGKREVPDGGSAPANRIGILSGGRIRQEFSAAEKAEEYGDAFEDYVTGLMRRNENGAV